MTSEKLTQVMKFYFSFLEELFYSSKEMSKEEYNYRQNFVGVDLQHCLWMIKEFLENNINGNFSIDKGMRWLGYIQGVLLQLVQTLSHLLILRLEVCIV